MAVNERSSKQWLPLESNVELMSEYIATLGAIDHSFADVYGTDDELLAMVPPQVKAVLLLFPHSQVQTEHAQQQAAEAAAAVPAGVRDVYFIEQHIANACGTIGLLHAVANNVNSIAFVPGSFFDTFLTATRSLTPAARAAALDRDTGIELAHQAAAAAGSSDLENAINENLHFIAFVCVEGQLIELDGTKAAAVAHGATTAATLLHDSVNIIKQFMARDPQEIRFNISALTVTQQD